MRVEKGKIIIEDGDKLGKLKLTKQQQDQLIEQNQKCVGYVIRKHFNFDCAMDKDDLFGYGYIGLCKAARDFNINLGNKKLPCSPGKTRKRRGKSSLDF